MFELSKGLQYLNKYLQNANRIISNAYNFMSYCEGPVNSYATDTRRWVSDYRWENLFNRMLNFQTSRPSAKISNNLINLYQITDPTFRLVQGILNQDGER